MILNKKYLTLFFLLIITSLIQSQSKLLKVIDTTKAETLNEILITATRTERQLSSLPLPAQIISKQELKKVNTLRLSDILNEQTGLITVPDFGGVEGIQLQGLDSQYTLILVDGVPLIGRSAGTLDLRRISVGNIKQIEIVKGASSSLYGSEALGGVINIITEKPKNGLEIIVNQQIASFETNDFSSQVNFKKNKLGIGFFINRNSSEGYDLSENDNLNTVEPFFNYTLNTKITYDFSEKSDLFVSTRLYKQQQNLVASDELKGESTISEWNTHLQFSKKYTENWSGYFEFYASRYFAEEYLNQSDNSRFSTSFFNQFMLRPELRVTYKMNSKSDFITGIGLTHETLKRPDFIENPEFNSPYVYLQLDTKPSEKLNIIAGARFDAHNQYASQFSPKLALRYEIHKKLNIKTSIGYGFKAPDFRQLYFDFTNATVGYTVLGYNAVQTAIPLLQNQGQIANILVPIDEFNASLQPESSVSFNLGTNYKWSSNLKMNLNIFRNNISNLIDTKIIANKVNGQNIFSYFNVNEVFTQGLEFNSSWKINQFLEISGGYQLLYAKDKQAVEDFNNGKVFARLTPSSPSFLLKNDDYFGLFNRSRHMANLKFFYQIPSIKLDANIRTTYRSKYGLFDANGNGYLDKYDNFVDGYAIVDFAINKAIDKNFIFGFGVDNLFNFTDFQNISNIPGQIIYGKMNFQF